MYEHTIEAQQTARVQGIGPSTQQETHSRANTFKDRPDHEQGSCRSSSKKSYCRICSDSLVDLTGASEASQSIVHLFKVNSEFAFAFVSRGWILRQDSKSI